MLTHADQLRARFAVNDRVGFEYRRQTIEGILIRSNPKRAVVRVGEEEFRVPYGLLHSLENMGMEREQRIDSVLQMAKELLARHGLVQWSFKFDHGTRRAGCCNYRNQMISISFDLARSASEEDIRETILHEIAHALVGKKHNHDAVWKAKAKEIGCTGERTHRLEFAPPRYHVRCEHLCWTHTAQRRNPRLVCRTCGGKLVYSPHQ